MRGALAGPREQYPRTGSTPNGSWPHRDEEFDDVSARTDEIRAYRRPLNPPARIHAIQSRSGSDDHPPPAHDEDHVGYSVDVLGGIAAHGHQIGGVPGRDAANLVLETE